MDRQFDIDLGEMVKMKASEIPMNSADFVMAEVDKRLGRLMDTESKAYFKCYASLFQLKHDNPTITVDQMCAFIDSYKDDPAALSHCKAESNGNTLTLFRRDYDKKDLEKWDGEESLDSEAE